MCAISGIVNLKFDKRILEQMLSSMRHRGPDATGSFLSRRCVFLHSRLSVIDPENGAQPMRLTWEGNEYVIAYNGELYNTQELRRLLGEKGHVFESHSDTEVVLHAYAQWGEAALEKMNGIFAFGVWETRQNRLFLARDRIGVKPLFYKLHNEGILFASEIKTILTYPTVEARLDAEGAAAIILLGPGRIPGSGVLKDIQELEPGCCGTFCDGKWVWKRYWKLTDREHTDSFEDTAAYVRFLVTDSIKRQMVSDVPLGTFLSGGLDSSIITAVCAEEMRKAGERLQTFSVDYENNDRYFVPGKFQPNSDNSYIKLMQERLDTDHYWSVLTPEQLLNSLEEATVARDLPGMADVDFSLLRFCGDVRQHVKVALSGECADEIFGGYPWYRDPAVRLHDGFPWAQNTKQRGRFLIPELTARIDPEAFVHDRYQQTIAQADILPGTSSSERRMKEMVCLNFRWFMQTLLDRKDRMSMRHGLEVRVPFCDYRIAEYLYGVPWEYKDHNGYEKGLLRHAIQGVLPDTVLWRKKSPYPKTHDPKYTQLVREQLKELLNKRQEPIYQLVRPQALAELLDAEYAWPWYGQLMQVPQTMAYMLQVNCWLKTYQVQIV